MHTQVSSCPKCGNPIYAATFHHSILPPEPIRTCGCFPSQGMITVNTTGAGPFIDYLKSVPWGTTGSDWLATKSETST